jgi:creatinine amidohydrolase/Fe(II)-dependent formamide hydrolase-like protein
MPNGTDAFQTEELRARACVRAHDASARVTPMPAVPSGVNANRLEKSGALALSVIPTALLQVLTDLAKSLELLPARKHVLLNGVGGNELKALAVQFHRRTGIFLYVCD